MKRARKLGLIVVSALALTAFSGAATASAAWLVPSETGKTFLKATPTNTHFFNLKGASLPCSGPLVEGSTEAPIKTFGDSTISSYKCAILGAEHTMNMNGCKFIFDVNGTFDIGPAGCGPLTMNYVFSKPCTLTIYPEPGIPVTYTNTGSGSSAGVTVEANGSGSLKHTDTCQVFGSGEGGTYAGSWKVQGSRNAAGTEPRGISVSPTAPVGLFQANGEFNAESYPVSVAGSKVKSKPLEFRFSPMTAGCNVAQLTGSLTAPATQLDLGMSLGSCTLGGLTTSVSMNGCGIGFDATTGDTEIACSGENSIEFESKFFGTPMCRVSVPAQTIGKATYGSTGSSFQRRVTADVEGTSMKYVVTLNVGSCKGTGSYSDGTFVAGFDIGASK